MGKYRRTHHDNHVYARTISSLKKPLWGKQDDMAYIMLILPR
jgi:hypothetical protein